MSTKLSTIYQHWHPQRASTGLNGLNGYCGYGLSSFDQDDTAHANTLLLKFTARKGNDQPALHRCPKTKTRVLSVYSQNRPRQEDTSVGPQASLSRQQQYKSKPKFFHRLSDTMHIPYATTRENQRSPYHPSPSLCSRQCPLPQS